MSVHVCTCLYMSVHVHKTFIINILRFFKAFNFLVFEHKINPSEPKRVKRFLINHVWELSHHDEQKPTFYPTPSRRKPCQANFATFTDWQNVILQTCQRGKIPRPNQIRRKYYRMAQCWCIGMAWKPRTTGNSIRGQPWLLAKIHSQANQSA